MTKEKVFRAALERIVEGCDDPWYPTWGGLDAQAMAAIAKTALQAPDEPSKTPPAISGWTDISKQELVTAYPAPLDSWPSYPWRPIETAPRDGTLIELWLVAARWHRPHGETYRCREAKWDGKKWVECSERLDGEWVEVESTYGDGRWMCKAVLWLPIAADPVGVLDPP